MGALLAAIRIRPEKVDDAGRCVAELVGNAVRHGREPVELLLHVAGDTLVVGVVDAEESLPHWPAEPADTLPAEPAPPPENAGPGQDLDTLIRALSTSGRGLDLVQHFSGGRCGAHPTRTRTGVPGKAVWFAQTCPPPPDERT